MTGLPKSPKRLLTKLVSVDVSVLLSQKLEENKEANEHNIEAKIPGFSSMMLASEIVKKAAIDNMPISHI